MGSSTRTPWLAAVALAGAQHGLVRKPQLVGCGFHGRAVRRLVLDERLQEVHPGVYGHGVLSRHARMLAAVWWAGEGAALSHESAAAYYGWLRSDPPEIHVTVPAGRAKETAGVTVHRSRRLDHHDVMSYDLLGVTDRARTLLDLAEHLDYAALRAVADELPALPKAALLDKAERLPGRHGSVTLQQLVHSEDAHARYAMERRSVVYFARHGVPEPAGRNVRVHGVLVDCAYPGFVVELDSRAHHLRRKQFEADRRRDRTLMRHGIHTFRLTWHDLDPEDPQAAWDVLHLLGTLS